VATNTHEKPLEKHYVFSREHSQKEILILVAGDAIERFLLRQRRCHKVLHQRVTLSD
jgi:hypothetical protein